MLEFCRSKYTNKSCYILLILTLNVPICNMKVWVMVIFLCFKLCFGYQILILGTLTQRKYCKKKHVSLKLLDLTKYWVREAVHGGSVLRCILCKKLKNMEDYRIMKLRCFYQPGGLKKRGEIYSKSESNFNFFWFIIFQILLFSNYLV